MNVIGFTFAGYGRVIHCRGKECYWHYSLKAHEDLEIILARLIAHREVCTARVRMLRRLPHIDVTLTPRQPVPPYPRT